MRTTVRLALTVLLATSLLLRSAACADESVNIVAQPATSSTNAFYVSPRAPLRPAPLIKLPVGTIRPDGWLRKQLELQAAGFHGHLGEISRFLVKEGNAWLDSSGAGDHGWEELPYWLKGYCNTAFVLRNETMLRESQIWIEAAIKSQKPDGWFGPDQERSGLATRLKGRDDLWPNMIMLFCLQDYHEFTGDQRVIELMTRYFRYLHQLPSDQLLLGYWPKMRGGDLLMSVYWLYNRTHDAWLLDLAQKVHQNTADWTSDVINWHNVNMSQAFGQPTTYFLQSGQPEHLRASYRNYDKIRQMYGQVPGGMFGGDENCRPGFTDPRQAVETCGMVEMMLSTETLTWITGDLLWADRCEDVAFNSLPAALTADLKALRYLTSPNMVLSDRQNKSPGLQNGGPMLHMNPHIHRCCQHNFGHGWPYFAEHLWFATPDNGLAAVFFSECQVSAQVGSGTEVTVLQETHYPFAEEITFTIRTQEPVEFPLYLRVPGWCSDAELTIQDRPTEIDAKPHQFVRIERTWSDGDRVTWRLPMKTTVRRWTENQNSVSVDRGPLTYSLQIDEQYVRAGGTDEWPAWEIHPTTPWNYGLVLQDPPEQSFEVHQRSWPADNMPFTPQQTPILIKAQGRRIPQWTTDSLGLVGTLQPSPVRSTEPLESITLIPMGAARLRISSFPVIGDGPDVRDWPEPPQPAFEARASHCWTSDTVEAIADGMEPKNSADTTIPRFTWWDHRGTNGVGSGPVRRTADGERSPGVLVR